MSNLLNTTLPYNNKNTLIDKYNIKNFLSEINNDEVEQTDLDINFNINIYRRAFVHRSYCTRKNENFIDGNVNCPDEKQFESVRLCWLNQWGVWDYYTFNKKSTTKTTSKEKTYQQLEGTWNDRVYSIGGFRGGKKTFRRNSTESISINTDFVKEEYNTVFQELINSPEVFMLKGFQTDVTDSVLNQYVVPVRLTTKDFTTKTISNDSLIQYSFNIEKSLTLRTQSI